MKYIGIRDDLVNKIKLKENTFYLIYNNDHAHTFQYLGIVTFTGVTLTDLHNFQDYYSITVNKVGEMRGGKMVARYGMSADPSDEVSETLANDIIFELTDLEAHSALLEIL